MDALPWPHALGPASDLSSSLSRVDGRFELTLYLLIDIVTPERSRRLGRYPGYGWPADATRAVSWLG